MSDSSPRPLGDDLLDLEDLSFQVQESLRSAYREDLVCSPFVDPPRDLYAASVFHVVSELAVWLLVVVAVVAALFSLVAGAVVAVLAVLLFVGRLVLRWTVLAPANRFMREHRVRPAVVAQAYRGGFLPPEEDHAQSFTGVVVFSFDEQMSARELATLARACSDIKHGNPEPPLVTLKEMLLSGDTEFVRQSFRFPQEVAGNAETYAAPILWVRDSDLPDGYLSTDVQLIFVHPEHPEHPLPVPPEYWESSRSLALLELEGDNA